MSEVRTLKDMAWRLDRRSAQPLYRQIYERLREAIREGALKPGARLPSARSLASQLDAARGTVDLAYSLLSGEGYITGHGAAGTFVAQAIAELPRRTGKRPARRPVNPTHSGPASATNVPDGVRCFHINAPTLDAFPRTLWCRLLNRRARQLTVEGLLGADPAGYAPLREAIVAYLAVARGIGCHAGQVFITAGFQGALDLVARTFLVPGDSVWLEEPGYVLAREALARAGARTVPVPVDAQGLDVEQGVGGAPQARLAYVTPSHQAPLGVSLSLPRRLALLSWAGRSGAWIVEDDYNGELRYGSPPLPSLKSLDEEGRVLYAGSFSKILFPGLRLGYLVVPQPEVDRVRQLCRLMYLSTPPLLQAVVADFMTDGHLARHVRRMRSLYQQRRASLAAALHEVFADRLTLELQAGGMHLIARGPALGDDQALVAKACAQGLAPAALSPWYAERRQAKHGLLLGFTNITCEAALEAVMRLSHAIGVPNASGYVRS